MGETGNNFDDEFSRTITSLELRCVDAECDFKVSQRKSFHPESSELVQQRNSVVGPLLVFLQFLEGAAEQGVKIATTNYLIQKIGIISQPTEKPTPPFGDRGLGRGRCGCQVIGEVFDHIDRKTKSRCDLSGGGVIVSFRCMVLQKVRRRLNS